MQIKINYKTTLPLQGNAPACVIIENVQNEYFIEFIDNQTSEIVHSQTFYSNEKVYGYRQWYCDWLIKIYKDNELIHTDKFDLTNKYVFIKIDGRALGDNLAWIPYVDEFRKKHNCHVLCSAYFNDIFKHVYPDILFLEPNTQAHNVYTQYYIGAHDNDGVYSPKDSKKIPLQQTACDILGLEYKEIVPDLMKSIEHNHRRISGRYVCISEKGSAPKKEWKEPNGWQNVVNYLNSKGIKVVVISKEPTTLENVINLTGDYPLKERMVDLYYSEFFMGVSSGLSWVAWGCGKPVIMISDCTPLDHEFQTNMIRIGKNNLESVDYEIENYTSTEEVIKVLEKII